MRPGSQEPRARPRPLSPDATGGPLGRLERARQELVKAWLMRLIERSSLDELRSLPSERIAAELPDLISDLLRAAGAGVDPCAMTPEAQERAVHIAELRGSGSAYAAIGSVSCPQHGAEAATLFEAPIRRCTAQGGRSVASVGDPTGPGRITVERTSWE